MAEANDTWKRFWCARDGFIRLDDLGYVVDPEGPFGSVMNPNVRPFEEIDALPCLILLGEPGMGKSVALRRHFEDLQEQARAGGGQVLWRDLRQYQTDDRLHRSIFESPEFLAWQRGTHRLYLFLDSLDEALLHIKPIASLLAEELKRHRPDHLMLRITCRSAEWPSDLEAELKEHWGHEHTGVFDLVPLRRRDIENAAAASGIPVEPFLQEVERAGAVPLAIKPLTLNFLIKTYRAEGRLPPRQAELYAKGCRYL